MILVDEKGRDVERWGYLGGKSRLGLESGKKVFV
jgi:hypothetical protein